MAQQRTAGWTPEMDNKERQRFDRLAQDDYRRFLGRLPERALRKMIRESIPGIDDTKLDSVIKHMKTELEADPYALLQPIEPGNAGAQLKIMKGYSLETAMYLAALTGAVLYTDLKAHWEQLHLRQYQRCRSSACD